MCGAKFVRAPRVHGFLNLLNHDSQSFPAVLRSMAHKKFRDLTIILLAWKITCLSLVLEEHCFSVWKQGEFHPRSTRPALHRLPLHHHSAICRSRQRVPSPPFQRSTCVWVLVGNLVACLPQLEHARLIYLTSSYLINFYFVLSYPVESIESIDYKPVALRMKHGSCFTV